MNFKDTTVKFQPKRRSSIGSDQWMVNRESLLVSSGASNEECDLISPTSSITENSHSTTSVDARKLAQGWQQKKEQQLKQQQKQAEEPQILGEQENKTHTTKNNTSKNNDNDNDSLPLIMEPKDVYGNNVLSEDEVRELFVEMSFYARLGFLQPPCCLLCTYQEAMKENEPDLCCPRWIVWRRNAETPLHPNQLDGNMLITKCYVSRNLLNGETVGGYAWDSANKKVVLACDGGD
ncbi:expressed unknown protein [Seminavis robusta]|uniref:Uncharacterized protein n=1 Tax=Seminavis robusta TaxID=568900 RepID=A0A9N8DAF1_9STRA|nr:expressed unknown protein [Seminavis robusta]|eukprot:Sro15_g011000.1 n/a (235) ;mRNA; r:48591-49295